MKVGLRVIKTVLAVALCFLIDAFRGGMPFFAVISAILCLQKGKVETYSKAITRVLGTLIGGGYGLFSLLLFQYTGVAYKSPVYVLVISLMAILIINTNLWIKNPISVGFSCVVYYSVVIGHFQDLDPFLFVRNRMLDTFIGIGVALFLNYIFPFKGETKDPMLSQ
ncbi:MAG TPA: aromatic acid exporter family protein [Clostridia bacterium]|nr:aromatic acid exporter family protein [Clostridia bacterium]